MSVEEKLLRLTTLSANSPIETTGETMWQPDKATADYGRYYGGIGQYNASKTANPINRRVMQLITQSAESQLMGLYDVYKTRPAQGCYQCIGCSEAGPCPFCNHQSE